jgi:hypothetical protein
VFALTDARDILIRDSLTAASPALSVAGAGSTGIVVETSGAHPAVVTGPEVATGAVQVR